MICLDEAALVRVHWGDATGAERAHAAGCAACTRAIESLATDLGRIDAVLRDGVAMRRASRPARIRLVPIAAAAVLVLALLVGRLRTAPVVADEDDTLAMVDEVATAVATYDVSAFGLGDDEATTAQSTCTWGEPFLEMGCDEPAVTLVAWR